MWYCMGLGFELHVTGMRVTDDESLVSMLVCSAGAPAATDNLGRDELPSGGNEILRAGLRHCQRHAHPLSDPGHPADRSVSLLASSSVSARWHPCHVLFFYH